MLRGNLECTGGTVGSWVHTFHTGSEAFGARGVVRYREAVGRVFLALMLYESRA